MTNCGEGAGWTGYGHAGAVTVGIAKIPKDKEPKSLTLEECQALLAAAPERGKWGRKGGKFSKFAPKGAAKDTKASKDIKPAESAKPAKGISAKGAKGGKDAAAIPVKLAAKGKKTAVHKRAPAASKAHPKVKKKPAKKRA